MLYKQKNMIRSLNTITGCLFLVLAAANWPLSPVLAKADSQTRRLVVVDSGISDFEIVCSGSSAESVKEGANELQRLIYLATGAELKIVDKTNQGNRYIVLGNHPLAVKAGITADTLKHDSFRIRTFQGNIFIVGRDSEGESFLEMKREYTPSAGTYYGVVEFARRFIGVRWYMPTLYGENVPVLKKLTIPSDCDIKGIPHFPIRHVHDLFKRDGSTEAAYRKEGRITGHYYNEQTNELNVRWARHLRLGVAYTIDRKHAWWRFVPATEPNKYVSEVYGKTHPEYYALRNGKRHNYYTGYDNKHGGQLCVSNPNVSRVYADNIIAYSKRTGKKSFSLSCNDGAEHCQCDGCRAWDVEQYRGDESFLTDRLSRFSNIVAGLVTEEIPDMKFGFMAYHETRRPPLETVLNPAITVCDVYNSWPYRFYNPEDYRAIVKDMTGWRKMAKNVIFTSYYTSYGHWSLPWSTLEPLSSLVKILAQYPSSSGVSLYIGNAEVAAPVGKYGPDLWVLGQLLWDPNQSVETLENEYYTGAFGEKAAPLIKEYFDTISDSMKKEIVDKKVVYYPFSSTKKCIVPAYSAVRVKCSSLIRQAEAAVADKGPKYQWRVDKVARCWHFVELTLDAIAATETAKKENTQAAWEHAVELGLKRRNYTLDCQSTFAISPITVDFMDRDMPSLGISLNLGTTTKLPDRKDMIIP